MSRQTVMHVYFGNAKAHPIVMNYIRCKGKRHHDILLDKPFGNKLLRLAQLFWRLVRLRIKDSSVIVHAHDVVSATLAASLLFENVIFDSHEIYASLAGSNLLAGIVSRMERYAVRRSGLVVYPSRQRMEYSVKAIDANSLVIENLFLPTGRTLNEEQSLLLGRLQEQVRSSPGRHFLYAGTFSPVRGVEEIIDAFSDDRLRGDSLFLAGKASVLVDQLLEQGLASVEFLGELAHDVMIGLLPCFDAGIALYKPINANNRLAAPTKLFEFLYFGLAVITNRSTYIEEVVQKFAIDNVYLADSVTREDILQACMAVGRRRNSAEDAVRQGVSWTSQLPRIEAMYTSFEDNRLARNKGLFS